MPPIPGRKRSAARWSARAPARLIGNAIGGAAGNRAAGGDRGAAIGGMLGNRIGAAMDDEDKRRAYAAQVQALESGPSGAPVAGAIRTPAATARSCRGRLTIRTA